MIMIMIMMARRWRKRRSRWCCLLNIYFITDDLDLVDLVVTTTLPQRKIMVYDYDDCYYTSITIAIIKSTTPSFFYPIN
eukprot:CAMPEP_0170895806 /NCGR_PEP_ID=MMETSP0734-20130129/44307_1 /TAXON_ID=186038 /ORGANISM="Fragilariopsis kerguelensis, Strain L26-C5" /LENGTH=78 /DNA_ID=CAMNT_0011287705 /DNA_START=272 /DNA_END=505 /DNA_ORIENTATION=-